MKIRQLVETEYGNRIDLSNGKLTILPSDLPDTVSDDFWCDSNQLTSLEHCPSQVGGGFHCQYNRLTSLEHCPSQVGGSFLCHYNSLTSLEHCPSQVGGNFSCSSDMLTSLEGCPSEVGGDFFCHKNKLTSLEDIHKQIKKIGGDFFCNGNKIKSHILGLMLVEIGGDIVTKLGDIKDVDEILNRWKNQGRKGALGCQRELLDLGYKELAQL